MKELKERIKALKNQDFRMRTDNNEVLSYPSDNLTFRFWEKTAGENWGNCKGVDYTISLGNKYAKMEVERFRTNEQSEYKTISIKKEKLIEILALIEEFEKEENETDKEVLSLKNLKQIKRELYYASQD